MRDALLTFRREADLEGTPPNFIEFPNPEWSFVDAGQYHLVYRRPETAQALEKLRAKFHVRQWTSKWSEKKISEVMASAIEKAMVNPTADAVLEVVTQAVAELDAPASQQRVIVAVGGVQLLEEVAFGIVRLFQMDDTAYAALLDAFDRIIGTTTHSPEEQEQIRQRSRTLLLPLRGAACVEVQVNGDVARAQEEATAESEPVVDLLQVVAAIEEPSVKKIRIVAGGLTSPPAPRVVLSGDGTEAHFNQSLTWGFRLSIDRATLDRLRGQGFGPVLDALGKISAERSEFESLLLNAIHWIADAERQEQLENRITSYVTTLEMFFSAQGSPIVRDVSEGVAYALGGSIEDRKRNRDAVTKLYGLRSKVSHEGQRSIVKDEIAQLKVLTINFVARMSRLAWRFSAREDVSAWIADLRLSGTYSDDAPIVTGSVDDSAPVDGPADSPTSQSPPVPD